VRWSYFEKIHPLDCLNIIACVELKCKVGGLCQPRQKPVLPENDESISWTKVTGTVEAKKQVYILDCLFEDAGENCVGWVSEQRGLLSPGVSEIA